MSFPTLISRVRNQIRIKAFDTKLVATIFERMAICLMQKFDSANSYMQNKICKSLLTFCLSLTVVAQRSIRVQNLPMTKLWYWWRHNIFNPQLSRISFIKPMESNISFG